MGLAVVLLGLWVAGSLGLGLVWVAVVYGTPASLRPLADPPVFVPQPRPEHVDLTDAVAPAAPAAVIAPEVAVAGS